MGNIIRFNDASPNSEWLSMSNQGTDCFLELLIHAADTVECTKPQEALIAFLKEQKDINEVAPGTAGFDVEEMPWKAHSLSEDVQFLLRVVEAAKSLPVQGELRYTPNKSIVIPWFDQFMEMLKQKRSADSNLKKRKTGQVS